MQPDLFVCSRWVVVTQQLHLRDTQNSAANIKSGVTVFVGSRAVLFTAGPFCLQPGSLAPGRFCLQAGNLASSRFCLGGIQYDWVHICKTWVSVNTPVKLYTPCREHICRIWPDSLLPYFLWPDSLQSTSVTCMAMHRPATKSQSRQRVRISKGAVAKWWSE